MVSSYVRSETMWRDPKVITDEKKSNVFESFSLQSKIRYVFNGWIRVYILPWIERAVSYSGTGNFLCHQLNIGPNEKMIFARINRSNNERIVNWKTREQHTPSAGSSWPILWKWPFSHQLSLLLIRWFYLLSTPTRIEAREITHLEFVLTGEEPLTEVCSQSSSLSG